MRPVHAVAPDEGPHRARHHLDFTAAGGASESGVARQSRNSRTPPALQWESSAAIALFSI